MATITDLANSIATMEGWNVSGSLAQRNNNPGNIRFVGQAGATLGEGGFAKFSSVNDGWNALSDLLNRRANQGMTLKSLFYSYAPPTDNNNTDAYISFVSKQTGVSPDTTLNAGFQQG
jgi:hypothetical protein